MNSEHVDVLIIGAGLSGIGAAAQLTREHPDKSYAVLEMRQATGGTWDLFRYPGIRSDSDMYTLGYRFKPWKDDKALADAPAILDYVRETAREYDVERHIRTGHTVTAASWDSASSTWTVDVDTPDGQRRLTTGFLWCCSGYYDYDEGYTPALPGVDRYAGTLIHPQHWPEDLDYRGKRVVVIGSGATAVTLVPAMAESGVGHVTMLQRSPTYVLSLPAVDGIAHRLRKVLPEKAAYALTRWKNVAVATAAFQLSRRRPRFMRKLIRGQNAKLLPAGYDVDTHFNPRYDPWDQRLCLVPDANLFRAVGSGTAEIVTDTIETFTETGIRLASGRELDADIVVTATGLNIRLFGGIEFTVDGEKVHLPDQIAYKALMISGLPNYAYTIGYTNASWTLKADLVAEYVCRLLGHMDQHGHRSVVPVPGEGVEERPFLDFQAGYVLRALDRLPSRATSSPGGSGRTTSTTCAPSGAARSTTGRCGSADPYAADRSRSTRYARVRLASGMRRVIQTWNIAVTSSTCSAARSRSATSASRSTAGRRMSRSPMTTSMGGRPERSPWIGLTRGSVGGRAPAHQRPAARRPDSASIGSVGSRSATCASSSVASSHGHRATTRSGPGPPRSRSCCASTSASAPPAESPMTTRGTSSSPRTHCTIPTRRGSTSSMVASGASGYAGTITSAGAAARARTSRQ